MLAYSYDGSARMIARMVSGISLTGNNRPPTTASPNMLAIAAGWADSAGSSEPMVSPSAANGIVPSHIAGISVIHGPADSLTCRTSTAARHTSTSEGSTSSNEAASLVTMIVHRDSGVTCNCRNPPPVRSWAHGTALDIMAAAREPYAAMETMRTTLSWSLPRPE
ncbi:hypothetical protein Acor_25180 [Acrocarpospora corrugata]|uniref:Uncharacterized protein n=1 Tax=Acrocarpospora corrugata TaxID=35763 RepID=A0A5M3VVC1_9ACTN|nr:hypothetical protein [Acrocarpospora corrugata]GES00454.1 hypothetical protein Acor_25180 [Acrocarpospora corrugata]